MKNFRFLFTKVLPTVVCIFLCSRVAAQVAPVPPMPGREPIIPTIVNEAYTVNNVRKLKMQLKADVIINQGPREALFVEGLKSVIKHIRATVVGGVLIIKYKSTTPSKKETTVDEPHPLIFRLTVTNLQGIEMNSGTVQSSELRTSEPFTLNFSGDAVAQLAIFSKELRADISGLSQVQIRGATIKQRLRTRNRARFLGQNMRSETCRVDVNDDSQAYVHARLVLEGTVEDDGMLYYVSLPQSNQVTLSGLGKMANIPEQDVTPPTTPQVLPNNPNPHGQGWNSTP